MKNFNKTTFYLLILSLKFDQCHFKNPIVIYTLGPDMAKDVSAKNPLAKLPPLGPPVSEAENSLENHY